MLNILIALLLISGLALLVLLAGWLARPDPGHCRRCGHSAGRHLPPWGCMALVGEGDACLCTRVCQPTAVPVRPGPRHGIR